MKIVKLAFAAIVIGVVLAGTAVADEPRAVQLRQPTSVRQTAFEYDNYLYFAPDEDASPSPSDEPTAAKEAPPDDAGFGSCESSCCEPSCCERSCGSCGGGCGDCCLGDPWTLPQPCFLKSRGITAGGWISAGLFVNAWGDANNGPLGFNDVADGVTQNQLWMYLGKAADTGGCGTDWGFRFDYVFGVDGPDTQAFGDQGWDFGWNSARDYGSAIPQLYLEFAVNDLSVKFGRFYTLIGYEVVQAPDNFFYTHSYAQYYAEPFTHMGFLAEYAMNDRVTLYGGWTAGWDSGWENLNDGSTFLGGVGLQLTDNTSLTWAVSTGNFGVGRNGLSDGDLYMNSIVFEWTPTDKFTYILQHDLGDNSGLGAADNEWYGINQYFLYAINDCWGAGLRAEWFRDDDGARVNGNAGNYYEFAWGVNYKPNANVTVRPEIRWDWFDGVAAAQARPFNEGRDNFQFSGGFDVIFTF